MDILHRILEILVKLWEYDIHVFSQPWIYWCLCVPAGVYLVFFFVKWTVITAPIWLPVVIIVGAFKSKK